jgi:hypothetical protein
VRRISDGVRIGMAGSSSDRNAARMFKRDVRRYAGVEL